MTMVRRTLLALLRARKLSPLGLFDVVRTPLRVMPGDLDLYRHMNNGVYASLADLGRWEFAVRSGLFRPFRSRGWYPITAAQSITYRKSLRLWQAYTLESRLIGYHQRNIYVEHRFVRDGEVYARSYARLRLMKRSGGHVSEEDLLAAVPELKSALRVPEWLVEWSTASALPSSREAAPSIWL